MRCSPIAAVTAERCGAARFLKYSAIAAEPDARRCASVPQITASGSYIWVRRPVSRWLKASTQAVVAAAICSCALEVEEDTRGAGSELNFAGASPVDSAITFTVPSARKRVVATSAVALRESTGRTLAQSDFGSTMNQAEPPAAKSCSMRVSGGFAPGAPRQRIASTWRPDETRKRVFSPDLRSKNGWSATTT